MRRTHLGEGEYDRSEQTIRKLLAEGGASVPRPSTLVADATPTEIVTPESYVGYQRLDPERYVGSPLRSNRSSSYRFPRALPQNALSFAGTWKLGDQRALAGANARLRLHFHARNVYLVLGGSGRVQTCVDGRAAAGVKVTGNRLYTRFHSAKLRDALLELRFAPGVDAYAFTFG